MPLREKLMADVNEVITTSEDKHSEPVTPSTPPPITSVTGSTVERTSSPEHQQEQASLELDRGDPPTRHGDCFLLCSYNTKILSSGDLDTLLETVRRVKFHVIALQDTRSPCDDIRQLDDGTLIILGGRVPTQIVGGVGFVVRPSLSPHVISHSILSPRVAILRFKTLEGKKVSIINCFSPPCTAARNDLDAFYAQLEYVINEENCYYKFVIGSFDAIVGKAREGEFRVGKYGMGVRNANGNRLVTLLSGANLIHGNSFFRKKDSKRWTWESYNGSIRTEIDHVLINRRWCLFDVTTIPSVSTGSSHRLLRAKFLLSENLDVPRHHLKRKVDGEDISELPVHDSPTEDNALTDHERNVEEFQNCLENSCSSVEKLES